MHTSKVIAIPASYGSGTDANHVDKTD